MKISQCLWLGLAMLALSALTIEPAVADCCGPPPATASEIPLGPGWSGSLFFERMEMRSLLSGEEKVAPDQILRQRLNAGAARYSVPTSMLMDRAAVQLRYQFDDNHALRLSLPWRFNQMDMAMAQKPRMAAGNAAMGHHAQAHPGPHDGGHNGGGHDQGPDTPGHTPGDHQSGNHMAAGHTGMVPTGMPPVIMEHTMDPVDGLGDVTLNYIYSLPLEQSRVYLGAGVALPTGQWTMRDERGQLLHNMMQPGAGAPAFMAETGADIALGESDFSLHPRLGVLWNATNPLGYQRGTRLDYELSTRYQATPELDLAVDLVGFLLAKDSTNGTVDPATGQVAFQRPETSLVDDVSNTGGSYLFLAPGLRWQPTEDISLGFQYRLPLHQDVNGTQLGIDAWYRGYFSARF